MKHIVYILVFVLLVGCNSDSASDCVQNAGAITQQEFSVDTFSKIEVHKDIQLIIKDDSTQRVLVETGEYLLNDIEVTVENETLVLRNNNTCNFTRDYGITKIYVNAPNITNIRHSSNLGVESDGVLTYPSLALASEDYYDPENYNVGTFNLQVACESLSIVINNITTSHISGTVTNLRINHASGDGRFEGRNLVAQNVNIYHRGTNDIIVNTSESLRAKLVSTGNVISVTTPTTISIEELYTGRVIFE